MSTLRANHLAKRYGDRIVIRDVSLEIANGSIVGLLGPNGSGKSTCFYMILGLIYADSGEILLDDTDLTFSAIATRSNFGIGYLPQEASIFRKLSVEDNILAILETRKELNKASRKHEMELLLKEFKITHIRKSLGMALSGGERRRVEIARALAKNPSFLLLDEPFAGVDPVSVSDMKLIIQYLKDRGIGVLITDHNVHDTLDICDTIYVLHNGVVIAYGLAQEIINDYGVKQVYLGNNFKL